MQISSTVIKRVILLFTILACTTGYAEETPGPAHHAGKKFVNPHAPAAHGGFFGIIKARLSDEWQTYDRKRDIVPTTDPALGSAPAQDAVVTWIGHATVLIQHQGVNVLTDPMFSQYASPVSFAGPRRITQPAIKLEDLPEIHAVVISHDHYDHLDTATIKALGNAPTYYVPLGIKRWMINRGIEAERVIELDWWQSSTLEIEGQRIDITATPTQHFSGRGLLNRNGTLWASWAIRWSDFNAWFGGDTGYNDIQFKQVGERLGPFDLGIIPIGAYEPRWFMGTIHVDPAEAVLIHQDIQARYSFGMHWGAFVLAGEGVLTPPQALATARAAAGLSESEFTALDVGETITLSPEPPITR